MGRLPAAWAAACVCLVAAAAGERAPAPVPRGASPELRARWPEVLKAGRLQCDGESAAAKVHMVNDNFCDCADGADEPGTSACSAGRFYCANVGHVAASVFSSRVGDGVCDCCDGADEPAGHCPNTCREAGASRRAELRDAIARTKKGLAARDKQVAGGASKRAGWEQELEKLKAEVGPLKERVDKLAARKRNAEKDEARVRKAEAKAAAAKAAEEEAARKAAEAEELSPEEKRRRWCEESEQHRQFCEDEGAESPEERRMREMSENSKQDAAAPESEPPAGDVEEPPADAGEPEEESAEELGRRIARQWTTDEAAAGPGEGEHADEEETHDTEDYGSVDEDDFGVEDEDDDGMPCSKEKPAEWDEEQDGLWVPRDDCADGDDDSDVEPPVGLLGRARLMLRRWLAKVTGGDSTAAEADFLRSEHSKENAKLSETTTRIEKLEKYLSEFDYGPDNMFVSMQDRCIQTKHDKYTYKVCPFEQSYQDTTQLGRFEGWGDNHTKMLFTNGMKCWNGPSRSMTVTLQCSDTEALVDLLEPSMCTYTATLRTPLACAPGAEAGLQAELDAMEAPQHTEL